MDETPTWFNQPIKKAVDFIGTKEPPLTYNEPNNNTVKLKHKNDYIGCYITR
jgi:hypothetical protein